MPTPIFDRDGTSFVATDLARGPWDADACHGGAPAGLLAAISETVPTLVPMRPGRLTFDLLRPVPVATPLQATSSIVREGKRIQVVELSLTTTRDHTELVRCQALRLRSGDEDLPAERPTPDGPPTPGPDGLRRFAGLGDGHLDGFWEAVDVRFVQGGLGIAGTGIAWLRLDQPIAEGLPVTPLVRAAVAADFGNGIGAPLPMGPYRYLNPDLTLDLHRLPVGEWIALTSRSVADADGIGLTTSTVADVHGVIGTALQTLFVDGSRV